MTPAAPPSKPTLARRLDAALLGDGRALDALANAEPVDAHDAAVSLLAVHDLHVAPLEQLDGRVRWQHHPAVAALKCRLEEQFLDRLDRRDRAHAWALPGRAPAALRALAVLDQVPAVYRYVAEDAGPGELLEFLTLEGGPDGGFDDLVAACQIGLGGEPKLEMARNYWDEMGNGELTAIHTELHRRLSRALGITAVPRSEQPLEALERSVLGSLLATNRGLQPEMVGALGLIELQAGPRCRKVLEGLRRIGAPDDALPFYEVHAAVDPKHGKDWVDNVVAPLADLEVWAEGMVRGARWRWLVNDAFFAAMADRFAPAEAERRAS
ncbi:MAG TPA: iron-containing redox enzyme family protein [Acidimicrobiia bacterium]|nr:iron-containing redox enzyme family protein [Acidimicrobiia bacterium]